MLRCTSTIATRPKARPHDSRSATERDVNEDHLETNDPWGMYCVADGVSGVFLDSGVDVRPFVQRLCKSWMNMCAAGVADTASRSHPTGRRLNVEYGLYLAKEECDTMKLEGSATFAGVWVDTDCQEAVMVVVGDCRVVVARGGQLVHKTPQRMYARSPTTPVQVYSGLRRNEAGVVSMWRPSSVVHSRVVVKPGDRILIGSDGLFDNFHLPSLVSLLGDASVVAADIVRIAHERSLEIGGKPDDISAILVELSPSAAA